MIRLVPITLERAKQTVREWHSHHDPMVGHMWATGAEVDGEYAGCVVVSRPVAPSIQNASKNVYGGYTTLEVTRLCCRGVQHGAQFKNVSSRLLASATASAEERGVILVISYIRVDEDGICYRAAGWVPAREVTPGRDHVTGNRKLRWLPGFYDPTTEKIDRIRWEWRPPSAIRAVCKMVFALGQWAHRAERLAA